MIHPKTFSWCNETFCAFVVVVVWLLWLYLSIIFCKQSWVYKLFKVGHFWVFAIYKLFYVIDHLSHTVLPFFHWKVFCLVAYNPRKFLMIWQIHFVSVWMIKNASLLLGFPQKFTYTGFHGFFLPLARKGLQVLPTWVFTAKEREGLHLSGKQIHECGSTHTANVLEALLFCVKLISFSLIGVFAVQWTLHTGCF